MSDFDPNAFIVETNLMAQKKKKDKKFDPDRFIQESQPVATEVVPDEPPTIGQRIAAGPVGEAFEKTFAGTPGRIGRGLVEGASEAIISTPRGFEVLGRAVPKMVRGKGRLKRGAV